MTKKNISDKIISIRVPAILFEKFKEMCDGNYETMSHALRTYLNKITTEASNKKGSK